jgi:heptosyltransferase-1
MPSNISAGDLHAREFGRILLVKPSSLGDIVHALPVLYGLRRRYPRAHIAWLAGRAFAPLIRPLPELNEVIEFDRRRYGKLGRSLDASNDFWRFVRNLRKRKFDLVVDLQGLFRSGFLAWATGAPVRIGFRESREFAWLFYTHRLPRMASDAHAVDRNVHVGELLGFDQAAPVFDLALSGAERAAAERVLREAGLSEGARFAAVLPTARWETKEWAPQRFTELLGRLAAELHLPVVMLGSPDDVGRCNVIAQGAGGQVLNLAGRTDLRGLAAVLERAAVVVCHDSGPTHIAAALGRPMVCMVGPTNPARTGPYRRPESIVRLDIPCSPCYLRRLEQCPHEHRCMRELTVDVVFRRVGELVAKSSS